MLFRLLDQIGDYGLIQVTRFCISDTDAAAGDLDEAVIADLIQQRQTARQQRDFATADEIRDRLTAMEVAVVDQPDGTVRWHRQ